VSKLPILTDIKNIDRKADVKMINSLIFPEVVEEVVVELFLLRLCVLLSRLISRAL